MTRKYGPDEASHKLDATAIAHSGFTDRLVEWLRVKGIDADPDDFVLCAKHADAR